MSEENMDGRVIAERFEIRRQIGKGGMGTVYECFDRTDQRQLALKMLHQEILERENGARNFRRECKALSHLQHPNILHVIDHGVDQDQPYLVTELCLNKRGQPFTLADLAREGNHGQLTVEELNNIFPQVFEGMKFIHGKGYIHRDLKPDNVFLSATDAGWIAKIADFGLIAITGDDEILRRVKVSVSLTMQKSQEDGLALVGTYDYMSPEQKNGEVLDARSDVYSLGLMVFRLSTGQDRIKFRLPCEIRPDLPKWVDQVVKSSVEEDVAARPGDAGALLELLRDGGDEGEPSKDSPFFSPPTADPSPVELSVPKTIRRRPSTASGTQPQSTDSTPPPPPSSTSSHVDLSATTVSQTATSSGTRSSQSATGWLILVLVVAVLGGAVVMIKQQRRAAARVQQEQDYRKAVADYEDKLTEPRLRLLRRHGTDKWKETQVSLRQAERMAQEKQYVAANKLMADVNELVLAAIVASQHADKAQQEQRFDDAIGESKRLLNMGKYAASRQVLQKAQEVSGLAQDARIIDGLAAVNLAEGTAALRAAKAAVAAKDWEIAQYNAVTAHDLLRDKGEAVRLMSEIKALMRPQLAVVARINGKAEVGAEIRLNGQLQAQRTPATVILEAGKTYQVEVVYPRLDIPPKVQSLTASHHGTRDLVVDFTHTVEKVEVPKANVVPGPIAPVLSDMLVVATVSDLNASADVFEQLPAFGVDQPALRVTHNGWRGKADFDLRMRVGWGNEMMVWRFDIRDDKLIHAPKGQLGDRIVLHLASFTCGPFKDSKNPWTVTLDPQAGGRVSVMSQHPNAAKLGDAESSWSKRKGGYSVQLRLPLSRWAERPAVARTMRCQVTFHDVDQAGGAAHLFSLFPIDRDHPELSDPSSANYGKLKFVGDKWIRITPAAAAFDGAQAVLRLDYGNMSARDEIVEFLYKRGGSASRQATRIVRRRLAAKTTIQRDQVRLDLGTEAAGDFKLQVRSPTTSYGNPDFTLRFDGTKTVVPELAVLPACRAPVASYPGNRDAQQIRDTFRHLAGGGEVLWSVGQYDASSHEFAHRLAAPGPVTLTAPQAQASTVPWALYGGRDVLDGCHEPMVLKLANSMSPQPGKAAAKSVNGLSKYRLITQRNRRLLLIGVIHDFVDEDGFPIFRATIKRAAGKEVIEQPLYCSDRGGRGSRHVYVQRIWLSDQDRVVEIDNPGPFSARMEIDFIALLQGGSEIVDPHASLRFEGAPETELYNQQIQTSRYLLRHYFVDDQQRIRGSLPGGHHQTATLLDSPLFTSELAAWGHADQLQDMALKAVSGFQLNQYDFNRVLSVLGVYGIWRKLPRTQATTFLNRAWRTAVLPPMTRLQQDIRAEPIAGMRSTGEFGGGKVSAATIPMYFASRASLQAAARMAKATGNNVGAMWTQSAAQLAEVFRDRLVTGKQGRSISAGKVPESWGLPAQSGLQFELADNAWLYGLASGTNPLAHNGLVRTVDTPYLFAGLPHWCDYTGFEVDGKTAESLTATIAFLKDKSPLFRQSSWRRAKILNYKSTESQLWMGTAALLADDMTLANDLIRSFVLRNYDERAKLPQKPALRSDIELSPFTFEERIQGSASRPMTGAGDDLNVRNGTLALKVARLMAGLDDHHPEELRLTPRLPSGWRAVSAEKWQIGHRFESGRFQMAEVSYRFEVIAGQPARYRLRLKSPHRLERIKIRVGPFSPLTKKAVIQSGDQIDHVNTYAYAGSMWATQTYRLVKELELEISGKRR